MKEGLSDHFSALLARFKFELTKQNMLKFQFLPIQLKNAEYYLETFMSDEEKSGLTRNLRFDKNCIKINLIHHNMN